MCDKFYEQLAFSLKNKQTLILRSVCFNIKVKIRQFKFINKIFSIIFLTKIVRLI